MAKQKKSKMALYTKQDKIILYCGYALLGLFLLAIIVPMIYIVIASFMDPVTLQNKGISFDFSKWSLDAYQRVVSDKQIWVGFKNAILYSIIFTIISVVVTMLAAYPMSLPDFKGKAIFNTLFVITMFFSGGLIPFFLIINLLGLYDTYWLYLIPCMYSVYHMIIIANYFRALPEELREAAVLDGAGEWRLLYTIAIPLSTPVIATVGLWTAIGHWNSYFDSMVYTQSESLTTLQYYLMQMINSKNIDLGGVTLPDNVAENITAEVITFASIMVSILPVMFIFPFLTRFFEKGIMIGSLKG